MNWVRLEYSLSGNVALTFFLTGLCEQSKLASFRVFSTISTATSSAFRPFGRGCSHVQGSAG